MSVIDQRNALVLVHSSVAQRKLRTANGISLHTDAENLAFDAWLDLSKVIWFG